MAVTSESIIEVRELAVNGGTITETRALTVIRETGRELAVIEGPPDLSQRSLCTWFAFWAQFVVLGFAAVLGGIFGGAAVDPGDQTCGVVLSLSAFLLMFMRLKTWYDTGSTGWVRFLFVDDMNSLVAAIVVFVLLALAGMFIASRVEFGGLHNSGVALVLASTLGILFSIKNVFDVAERRH